jgi:hypothetical protein
MELQNVKQKKIDDVNINFFSISMYGLVINAYMNI